jgi:hypothetical protein
MQCGLFGIAVMNFVNGSVNDEAMHDLRHLGIWQASLGISVVVLSFWFRLSLFIVSTTTSFIVLTTVATVFDLVMGHRGPWADATHVIEACVVVLLLILSWPRARLTIGERGRPLPPIRRDS